MATFSLKLLGAKVTPRTPMIPGEGPWRRPGCKRLVFFFFFAFPFPLPTPGSEGWEGGK